MRVLSGIQPSGKVHLGNYFGMMRPALELQKQGEAFLFIADYHALTTVDDPAALKQAVRDIAIDYLACGLDTEKTVFYRQSDVPEVQELTWLLSVITPMGLLERCHSYKDKIAKGIAASHGLFAYPVLMAADILIMQSNLVPVGRDQKQHVEVTRDIAIKFNNQFGEVFTIPEPSIREEVAVVPGLDGQKMSKSYNNTVDIFAPPKEVRKKIMGIVTDSKTVEDAKDPSTCNVFALFKLFANDQQRAELEEQYRRGGMGYGAAKSELFDLFEAYFAPLRARREEIAKDTALVDRVLAQGATRAQAEARKTLKAARQAVGLE